MKKLLSYPLSLLAYFYFLLVICVFHPIQWVCLNWFGYNAHKKSVDYLGFFLLKTMVFTFSSSKVENLDLIPEGKPLIFVSNHQSLFDIMGFVWFFRKFHPKFVSKIELGKHIPSISYNLNHGGSVLIDRKNPKQALPAIKKLGEYIETNSRSAVIFPEGTRSKTGKPKRFSPNGLKILCKYAPSAYVVPVTINDSWKMFQYGSFPLGLGNRLTFTVHPPIKVSECDFDSLLEKSEQAVVSGIRL
ncbi:1-acyl-sn-glycerol-3-phosphate acyltransferase [Bacteroides luti]|jgi:1-acyl-sn-glycerol-3-phosphate acyltransferase|uniref:1-acyl-sn-glycerol-3-phosphate acyltransferase n=1 Tax=Bacteroides luti TaxID=1297750 RepID=A0A1M4XSV1_9BACE|nr:lysophospholipid acyltransferase family protein [Bacteroides luti]SHE96525.1 1-acyl-sn-glycerol-3-phosphate acyltransferase [Bacteroides luti]